MLVFAQSITAYADGNGTGLTGQYFQDSSFGTHLQGTPFLTQVDPTINFDFVNAPPRALTLNTNFSVKWTGQVQPIYSETYLFMTYSDDGVRVVINGQQIINDWSYHSGTWDWNWITLQAGQLYDIEVDYFQGVGAANVQLWWQSPSQGKEIIPQTRLYPPGSSTYYVSPSGSDSNSGTSAGQPWQTIARVNQQLFNPGDNILFQSGGTFAGALQPQGSGVPGSPIIISKYGSGPNPIIDGTGQESALKLFNQEYWQIDSLEITGGERFGIFVSGDRSNTVLHYFRLTNLAVHDMYGTPRWDSGLIMMSPMGDHLTFDDVVLDGITAYNTNLWYGIHVGFNIWYSYPTNPPMSANVTIRNSQVHDVYGDGITVAMSSNVLIEKNVTYQTGLAPPGVSYTPNAIWSWQCNNTVVQFNEGYSSHSYSYDGGVFDIDFGSTNTTIQYNYAHNADGYCVAVLGGHNLITSNSIVRFNICSNNGRHPSMGPREGDIFISTFDGGSLDGIQIYNNTGYWNPTTDGGWINARNVSLTGSLPRFIQNNIVFSATPTLIDVDGTIPMDHNLYWAPEQIPTWRYADFVATSLPAFQQMSGQETNGLYADPKLNSGTYSSTGMPTSAFTLNQASPAIGSGATWSDMGSVDFFGNSLPEAGSPDIGADYVNGVSSQPPGVWVNVVSKNSGKCLDVTAISTSAGAPLQQWTCWGGDNQKFQFTPVQGGFEITAKNSGLQLDVAGGPSSTQDGTPVIQWPYWGGTNEIWQIAPTTDGYYSITALNSGKCLDVTGISMSDGATVQQWSCWGGDNQKWQLVPVP
ncbi:MAG TPA: RICIN domain-containing protein [Bryobacteraceae bacterium]|nr:RICIN domain-containing protein [Bryobacteraceae bacterium]